MCVVRRREIGLPAPAGIVPARTGGPDGVTVIGVGRAHRRDRSHSGRTAPAPCASRARATTPRWISEVPS